MLFVKEKVLDSDTVSRFTLIAGFVRETKLWEKHPGLRLYGFNHPGPVDDTGWCR